jgi:hypothetical protein
MRSGSEVFSHNLADALSSPLQALTTEFGMGSGRTLALKPPGLNNSKLRLENQLESVLAQKYPPVPMGEVLSLALKLVEPQASKLVKLVRLHLLSQASS